MLTCPCSKKSPLRGGGALLISVSLMGFGAPTRMHAKSLLNGLEAPTLQCTYSSASTATLSGKASMQRSLSLEHLHPSLESTLLYFDYSLQSFSERALFPKAARLHSNLGTESRWVIPQLGKVVAFSMEHFFQVHHSSQYPKCRSGWLRGPSFYPAVASYFLVSGNFPLNRSGLRCHYIATARFFGAGLEQMPDRELIVQCSAPSGLARELKHLSFSVFSIYRALRSKEPFKSASSPCTKEQAFEYFESRMFPKIKWVMFKSITYLAKKNLAVVNLLECAGRLQLNLYLYPKEVYFGRFWVHYFEKMFKYVFTIEFNPILRKASAKSPVSQWIGGFSDWIDGWKKHFPIDQGAIGSIEGLFRPKEFLEHLEQKGLPPEEIEAFKQQNQGLFSSLPTSGRQPTKLLLPFIVDEETYETLPVYERRGALERLMAAAWQWAVIQGFTPPDYRLTLVPSFRPRPHQSCPETPQSRILANQIEGCLGVPLNELNWFHLLTESTVERTGAPYYSAGSRDFPLLRFVNAGQAQHTLGNHPREYTLYDPLREQMEAYGKPAIVEKAVALPFDGLYRELPLTPGPLARSYQAVDSFWHRYCKSVSMFLVQSKAKLTASASADFPMPDFSMLNPKRTVEACQNDPFDSALDENFLLANKKGFSSLQ